jgi:hypothetical protein
MYSPTSQKKSNLYLGIEGMSTTAMRLELFRCATTDSHFRHATEQTKVLTPIIDLIQQTARTEVESANEKSCGNEDLRDEGEVHTGCTKMSVLAGKGVLNHLCQSTLLPSLVHDAS